MPSLVKYYEIMRRLKAIPAEAFKKAFIAYIHDNEHDLGWEGFQQRELQGFGHVVNDFLQACEAGAWYQPDPALREMEVEFDPTDVHQFGNKVFEQALLAFADLPEQSMAERRQALMEYHIGLVRLVQGIGWYVVRNLPDNGFPAPEEEESSV